MDILLIKLILKMWIYYIKDVDILEGFLSCGPLIQTEIDPSVTPNSALFSWWSLRNWFISPQIHKTKIPLLEKRSQLIPDHIITPVSYRTPIFIFYQLCIFFWDYKHSLCLILSIIVVVFNQIVLLLWVVTMGKIYLGVFLVNIGSWLD